MTKQQYLDLRNQVKLLARQIKETKIEFKQTQRDYSNFYNQHFDAINSRGYRKGQEWIDCQSTFKSLDDKQYQFTLEVPRLKSNFRYFHIAYSLARGKTYQQIEPKTKEGNAYSEEDIAKVRKEFELDVVEPQKEEATV